MVAGKLTWLRMPKGLFGHLSVWATIALLIPMLAGCGLGPGELKGSAELTVTRDFGNQNVAEFKRVPIREGDSVLRSMQSRLEVETAYGGGFVNSIEGLESDYTGSRQARRDWFFYVNGVESSKGASETRVAVDDAIWWDYRNWSVVQRVPAVVGAYPHPLKDANGRRKRTVRLDCASGSGGSCSGVRRELDRLGLDYIKSSLNARQVRNGVRVIVGTWRQIGKDTVAHRLTKPPASSSVFARFIRVGENVGLALYSSDGKVAFQTEHSAGLVAAVKSESGSPTWIVAGTDGSGLRRAVKLLNKKSLRNRFAVAATDDGTVALPIVEGGRS